MKKSVLVLLGVVALLTGAKADSPQVTVISDIDDTIKDTRLWAFGIRHFLLNPGALFASRPIAEMPETSRRWQRTRRRRALRRAS